MTRIFSSRLASNTTLPLRQRRSLRRRAAAIVSAGALSFCCFQVSGAADDGGQVSANVAGESTATGKMITPSVAHGAIFEDLDPHLKSAPERRPGGAIAVAISSDGKRLAVMTSGYRAYYDATGVLNPEASTEYVFIYEIADQRPNQSQVLSIPNTFDGLAWSSTGALFVSGGMDDDVVEFAGSPGELHRTRVFKLGHKHCLTGYPAAKDPRCGPVVAGIAVSPDGQSVLAANIQDDSVSLVDIGLGKVVAEQDLRPGAINPKARGVPGGSFPRRVVWTSDRRAYVGSIRDREIIALDIVGHQMRVRGRIKVQGQPSALVTNPQGSRLFVALDTTGQVAVYRTVDNRLIEKFNVVAPPDIYDDRKLLGGANTNALALTPDGRTLLVSNGGLNSVAVVSLGEAAAGIPGNRAQAGHADRADNDDDRLGSRWSGVVGLVPTGWYPTGVAAARDGKTWYIINAKSPTGPNSGWCKTTGAEPCSAGLPNQGWPYEAFASNGIPYLVAKNVHVAQLEHSGLLTMPKPTPLELARLTKNVAHNNRFDAPEKTVSDERLFSFLRNHIKHVVYIMKENRTYDQILGDLKGANGDPRLAIFPEEISPNHHALARNFVALDNLIVTGEGSINGAYWTFAAQTNDLLEHTDTMRLSTTYSGQKVGGFTYGTNRGDDIALPTSAERHAQDKEYSDDPDVLLGTNNVYDVDGPAGEGGAGYIWNAAIRAHVSVRDYGAFERVFNVPLPARAGLGSLEAPTNPGQVAETLADSNWTTNFELVPDSIKLQEWKREWSKFSKDGVAPSLMLMFLGGDHLGGYSHALYGVNTPETQMADNDYAVGLVVDTVSNSPFSTDTLIVTIEDDASDGPDHVSAQRTVSLFAGPYVRQHAVVSTRYTTVNVVKTIEEVLGFGPIGLNDALAAPMSDVFDTSQADWSYKAIVPNVLRSTQLPLPPDPLAHVTYPKHTSAYWQKAMADQDFSAPDLINDFTFNRELWRGLKGNLAYPIARTADRDLGKTR